MSLHKCVFLDRDGVLNRERGEYTYQIRDFEVINGVAESFQQLKKAGYLLIVITNQAGIAKNIYSVEDVQLCHDYLQAQTGGLIDDLYFCTHHPLSTESLLRKPNSLMLEKAIAKWHVDVASSYMIGDSQRDMEAASKINLKSILIDVHSKKDQIHASSLLDAVKRILC